MALLLFRQLVALGGLGVGEEGAEGVVEGVVVVNGGAGEAEEEVVGVDPDDEVDVGAGAGPEFVEEALQVVVLFLGVLDVF